MTKIIETLHNRSDEFNRLINKINIKRSKKEDKYTALLKNMRIVALIHDIGHYPFSHPLEEVIYSLLRNPFILEEKDRILLSKLLENNKPHEIASFFIYWSHLAKRLNDLGYDERFVCCVLHYNIILEVIKNKEIQKIINDLHNIDLHSIINYLKQHDTQIKFLHKLIDGDFDADRIDNLVRDSYYSGVGYGSIDIERLLNNIHVVKKKREYILAFNVRTQGELERFFNARYYIYRHVYHHHKVALFDEAIKRLVIELINIDETTRNMFLNFTLGKMSEEEAILFDDFTIPVSYTHLTLPTN